MQNSKITERNLKKSILVPPKKFFKTPIQNIFNILKSHETRKFKVSKRNSKKVFLVPPLNIFFGTLYKKIF